jgi:hypothetical protein
MSALPFLLSLLAAASPSPPPPIEIHLGHDSGGERKTKQQLEALLQAHDLSRYIVTRELMIDETVYPPHSDPVLTLNTRFLGRDALLLSTFVHEQLHWVMDQHRQDYREAIRELRERFPDAPVERPEGAGDRWSTYMHLPVCYLEIEADRQILGKEEAAKVLDFMVGDHYTWIYRQVRDRGPEIRAILERHSLILP